MSETQRKFDAQISLVPELHLESKSSNTRKKMDKNSESMIKRKQFFDPKMIFEIIERIKDL
jgi:hypothetical protein